MGSPTIMVVDDEDTVRNYIRHILQGRGFQLLEAVDGVDAIQKLQQFAANVDLLLTDVRMPRMDGLALARSVADLRPETPVVFISGFPMDMEEERRTLAAKICAFLPKPFTPKVLLATVDQCLSPQ